MRKTLTLVLMCAIFAIGAKAPKRPSTKSGPPAGAPPQTTPLTEAVSGIKKIDHIIWIIQENRSFDSYFGTFPGADGPSPSTCIPTMPGTKRCVKPFHMPQGEPIYDLHHGWNDEHAAFDSGRTTTSPTIGTTPGTIRFATGSSHLKWARA